MAQYEISTMPLIEAADKIKSVIDELSMAQRKIDGIISELPEKLCGFRQRMAAESETIEQSCMYAGKLRQVSLEAAEIYAQAERLAFSGKSPAKQQTTKLPAPLPPIVRKTHGVFFKGDLVMPDWLMAAVIKYEQAQPYARELKI